MEKYKNIIIVVIVALVGGLGFFLYKKGIFTSFFAKFSQNNEVGSENNEERKTIVNVVSNANALDLSASGKPAKCKWNNPLNIRYTSEKWQGKIDPPVSQNGKKNIEEFTDLDYGTRAAVKNLITYRDKYSLRTVSQIINR